MITEPEFEHPRFKGDEARERHYSAESRFHARAISGATRALDRGRDRLVVTGLVIVLAFCAVSVRLVGATCFTGHDEARLERTPDADALLSRADILDRGGQQLATSLATASLYADPKLVLDAQEAAVKLAEALPGLDYKETLAKLRSNKRFVWLKRNLTPRQHQAVHVLGLPGILFEREERRFYPPANLTAHVVGYAGVDNVGLAGLERFFDKRLKQSALTPLQTSLDLRLQHILRREIAASVEEFKAIGGNGIIMDVRTGEVLAMTSLPDFDPHEPGEIEDEQKFDRNTLGVYEMGSTFKIFNSAMALDSGKVKPSDNFDAINPIHIGRFTISDYHGKHRMLNVTEIFEYSSNLGSVHMALTAGVPTQQAFMNKIGFLKGVPIELPELGKPLIPHPWREINAMTIAFGHGMSVSPLHVAMGASAVINGGILHKPTLLKVQPGQEVGGERVISERTSQEMRKLFRIVVTEGTAKFADVPGYLVGGKTGTADKQRGRHYAQNANLTSFIGVFPINDPKYLVMVMIDEPKPSASSHGFATAGWTSAPAVGRVIRQIGPLLGVQPVDENRPEIRQALDADLPQKGTTLAAFSPDDDH
ncbi:MAG: penicillin-binding protein 2 [Rhodospirillaceae bacterium]